MPTFSGSYEEWCTFNDTFVSLIHNNSQLSNIQKFHYLKSALKGNAASVIHSFEITSKNYKEAWDLLKLRFDNKRWIVQSHISALFNLQTLQRENHVSLRNLIDSTLKHLRALKALGLETDHWDPLMIYWTVSKLDPVTRKEWETSLEDTELPTFESLKNFLFKRCHALESINNDKHKENNARTHEVKFKSNKLSSHVSTSDISCPTCKANHYAYNCEKFRNFPVGKRFQIIKEAHLCKNCLRSNEHQAQECKSGLCRTCNGKHHTLLHMQPSNNVSKLQSTPIDNTSNSL